MTLAKYAQSDSTSLANLGKNAFTVTASENSDYEGQAGVKLTLASPITHEGKEFSKVHTTRKTIVDFFRRADVLADLETEPLGPIKCAKKTSDKGREYYVLVDA